MFTLFAEKIVLGIDTKSGFVSSLKLEGIERATEFAPLFNIRFRTLSGETVYKSVKDATLDSEQVLENSGELVYGGFGEPFDKLSVKILVKGGRAIEWKIDVCGVPRDYALEWVEFPKICFPCLLENCDKGGAILFPYNEGMLVTNEKLLPRYEPEFPSSGAYFTFPNMVCSQFMAYLFDDVGFYIGAHDPKRSLKCVDFYPCDSGVSMVMRLYSGACYGEGFKTEYPIVWQATQSAWKYSAEIYREWFENNLPSNLSPIAKNRSLPKWYKDTPVIVTYPVRGIHDMDEMKPNALFPYTNAFPILNKIKSDTGCHVMALLMHWEGTAPWAPPYVWPPFGGVELFDQFKNALHENGDLLGVYCSGFGYTLKSTLTDYNCEEKIKNENVLLGVCHSPENKPELGRTCTPYQRYGYDICPASKRGREILKEGFEPLFESGVDYAQILDQNHGGGQYMCYGRDHGHPPMPGEWMTSNMQELLRSWNETAPNMVFGCESAAAEPFIGNLLMSDNRYELNYPFGKPVPVYAFIYHEYVRNFMGNQCGCPFEPKCDTLRYRLAYSFSIGDLMTLIIAPDGKLMTHWGTHDFENAPDWDKTMLFIKNVMEFYRHEGVEYLYNGKMSVHNEFECEEISIPLFRGQKLSTLPRLLSTSWVAKDGKTAYIVVNPESEAVEFKIGEESYTAPPLDAMLIVK